ncbi:MAG: fimbrillin family protein [Prevotella sp.]|nr:fimbrillin family protein [Prevotella sp.]
MKIKLGQVAAVLLAAMTAGCANDEAATGTTTDGVRLQLDVVEAGWQEERVSVTRSGETMEGLKANTSREWDFTEIPAGDLEALKSASVKPDGYAVGDFETWPEWNDKNDNGCYYNKNAISGAITVNGVELSMTSGLTFSSVAAGNFNITAKRIQMGGTNQVLTIPNLKTGQTVTIVFASASSDEAVLRTLTPGGNLGSTSGFVAANSTETQTGTGTVTADGSVTFTTADGAINIFSISVSRVPSDGFCLRGTNLLGAPGVSRQVTWDDAKGQWDAGNDIYWLRTSGGETFNVYAYAPYTTAYTYTEGEIRFSSVDDGRNVDLLYAAAEVKRSDGLARLTFRHALAKISFGTITNSTGEAISLKQVSVKGNLHKSGKQNLATGEWGDYTAYDPVEKSIDRDIDTDAGADGNQPLDVANGAIVPMPVDALLLIPGPTVTITLTIGRAAGSDETFSFTTTLEQGKNKTFNVTVEKNFEVVIDG